MTLTNSRVTGNSSPGFISTTPMVTRSITTISTTSTMSRIHTPSGDIWNTTLTPGTNIVGGSWLGGNYWAQPDGTGFSQSHGDSDNNGICDDAYSLPGGSDQLPLHVPTSVNQVTGPSYITTPGIYYLQNDILADSSGTSIQITSGNVVFDGMGHTVQGLGSGGTTGILVTKANVTVRNVTVTDWYYGISYQNTQYGTIDGVNASSNAFGIIYIYQ